MPSQAGGNKIPSGFLLDLEERLTKKNEDRSNRRFRDLKTGREDFGEASLRGGLEIKLFPDFLGSGFQPGGLRFLPGLAKQGRGDFQTLGQVRMSRAQNFFPDGQSSLG
jgi:hypothetical protein